VAAPDPLHGTDADPGFLGHRSRGPVRGLAGRIGERERHHALREFGTERRDPGGPGLIAQQAIHARLHEPLLPAPDSGLGHARLTHDLGRAVTIGGQQHDLGTPDLLLRAVAIGNDGEQPFAVLAGQVDTDPGAHALDSHAAPRQRNPQTDSSVRFYPLELRDSERHGACLASLALFGEAPA